MAEEQMTLTAKDAEQLAETIHECFFGCELCDFRKRALATYHALAAQTANVERLMEEIKALRDALDKANNEYPAHASPREANPRGYDCPDHGPSLTGCGCPSCVESSPREAGREVPVERTDVDCIRCGKPVGNTVFTICDTCWHPAFVEHVAAMRRPALPEKGGRE